MRVICILCDEPFQPDKWTEKKLRKHPHKIQLCPECYGRIKEQVLERQQKQAQTDMVSSFQAAEKGDETISYSND